MGVTELAIEAHEKGEADVSFYTCVSFGVSCRKSLWLIFDFGLFNDLA